MAPRQHTGQQCIARHGWHCDVLFFLSSLPPQPVCCAVAFTVGGAVEWHYLRQQPYSPDGDPEQQMGPRSATPQHEVELSRGPGQGHGWRAQTREGDGERPRRWRLRGSVGAEARQCPLNSASLAWMQRGTVEGTQAFTSIVFLGTKRSRAVLFKG